MPSSSRPKNEAFSGASGRLFFPAKKKDPNWVLGGEFLRGKWGSLDYLDEGSMNNTAEEREFEMHRFSPEIWPELESNQRHKDFQSSALPTELSGHKNHASIALRGLFKQYLLQIRRDLQSVPVRGISD